MPYHNRDPKRDRDFDNHPYMIHGLQFIPPRGMVNHTEYDELVTHPVVLSPVVCPVCLGPVV